jgi:ferritin
MLSYSIQKLLNQQLVKELTASNLYLAMSAHFAEANLLGMAHWMRVQSEEERGHALRILDFIVDRNGRVEIGAVDQPPGEFGAPVEIFKQALEHERKVTASISHIYAQAAQENDYATQVFLQWFINEQVEEEASATEMVDRLSMAGDDRAALLMLDAEMKGRSAEEEEDE